MTLNKTCANFNYLNLPMMWGSLASTHIIACNAALFIQVWPGVISAVTDQLCCQYWPAPALCANEAIGQLTKRNIHNNHNPL